ncbi:hypothetical protein MPLSOD_280058 [Mesorhizobium sp. SOD10]|nr:hypothetical protein MPLSOD_280058 [Mesorhizobium sp. SOD10]
MLARLVAACAGSRRWVPVHLWISVNRGDVHIVGFGLCRISFRGIWTGGRRCPTILLRRGLFLGCRRLCRLAIDLRNAPCDRRQHQPAHQNPKNPNSTAALASFLFGDVIGHRNTIPERDVARGTPQALLLELTSDTDGCSRIDQPVGLSTLPTVPRWKHRPGRKVPEVAELSSVDEVALSGVRYPDVGRPLSTLGALDR